jgi:hypothetical protein
MSSSPELLLAPCPWIFRSVNYINIFFYIVTMPQLFYYSNRKQCSKIHKYIDCLKISLYIIWRDIFKNILYDIL